MLLFWLIVSLGLLFEFLGNSSWLRERCAKRVRASGRREAARRHSLLFLLGRPAGGADRTSAHGSEFCFASGRPLIVNS